MSDMELKINGIGPINEADIKLGKLNIIGGPNGSGKSTSSRLLYCFLYAASPQGNEMFDEMEKSNVDSIGRFLRDGIVAEVGQNVIRRDDDGGNFELTENEMKKVKEIRKKIENEFKNNSKTIRKLLQLWYDLVDDLDIEGKDFYYDRLNSMYNQTDDMRNETKFLNLIANLYIREFGHNPFRDTFEVGTACFSGKLDHDDDKRYEWTLYVGEDKSQEKQSKNNTAPEFSGNVSYIDTISPLETLRFADSLRLPHHFRALFKKLKDKSKLSEDEREEFNSKYNKFQDRIIHLIDGKFEYASNDLDMDEHTIIIDNRKVDGFVFYKNDVPFNMKNSSSGSKQIGSIQMLLDNKQLCENDFLIIDEPEVNLHPEWQIELAELLVLLVKDFNITVYINSHSPQFIEALEVFSVKYEIDEDTRFYITVKNKDNDKFDFKEVHYANIGEFYQQLAKPYDIINEVRLENNLKDL